MKFRLYILAVAIVSAFLGSCGGGGSNLTSGIGGSGIGGTGIAFVRGNVATVVAMKSHDTTTSKVLARANDWLFTAAIAQAEGVEGIVVSGGGQSALTDQFGAFALNDVTPSDDFVILLTLTTGQNIGFGVGTVAAGTTVTVNNIVVNTTQGTASPTNIEVEIQQSNQGNSNSNSNQNNNSQNNNNGDGEGGNKNSNGSG